MKERFEYFLETEPGVNISFATNFKIDAREEYQNILVFNNGLVCSSQHYKHQVEYFDQLGYKIFLHDYRGHFQSKMELDLKNLTFDHIADDLKTIFKYHNIKTIHLIGHSMGVPVSAYLYLKNPELIKSMTFIGGTLFPVSDVGMTKPVTKLIDLGTNKKWGPINKFAQFIWKTGDQNFLFQKMIQHIGFNADKVDNEYVKFYLKKVSELGFNLFAHLFLEMKKLSFLSELESIKVPCLSIAGEKDKVVPHYLQYETSKRLPKGHYYFVKNGSHVPQIEFPNMINERINFFLQNFR